MADEKGIPAGAPGFDVLVEMQAIVRQLTTEVAELKAFAEGDKGILEKWKQRRSEKKKAEKQATAEDKAREKKEQALIAETIKLYKVSPEHVFTARAYLDTQEVVFVTNGGEKIRHKSGEPASVELTEVQITGIAPPDEDEYTFPVHGGRKFRFGRDFFKTSK